MTELHLDLCIQSTRHLLETVSKIKENVRILEVFINSGLTTVDLPETLSFIQSDYSRSEGKDSNSADRNSYGDILVRNRHSNCCCMCQYRQSGLDITREMVNRTASRASAATISMSSNQSGFKKSKTDPIMPRLNKTASLRRDSVLKQQKLKDLNRKKSFSGK